ncbi:apolipoprotein [Desmophyllum pertusum]|uniref:Apolipoprotein n=1 Tax=Desmophyllum pertusum TaxID=174260 RepID=A0A9X0CLE1_9CNID|nr:apolipoprotein [Desmophyllum pertusum]
MSQYFYIASRIQCKVPLVLEISSSKEIRVNPVRRAASDQLWKWDTGCRLVSKTGRVAAIKYGKKKEKACLVAENDKTDDFSQMWRVEQEVIKSTLNDLVVGITGSSPGALACMFKADETSVQKWIIVPEDAWDDYELMLDDPDPLTRAEFGKPCIGEYEAGVKKAVETIRESADHLDKVAKDTGITNTVGGSASVAAGGMALAGLALAPSTAGLSLYLTVVGSITGTAGAVTSLTGSIVNTVWEYKDANKTREASAPLFRATLSLQGLISEYQNELQKAAEFLSTPVGHKVAIDAGNNVKLLNNGRKIVWQGKKAVQVAAKTLKHYKKAQKIKSLVEFVTKDFYKLKETRHALKAAAPSFKIGRTTLVAARSVTAQVISGSMAVLGIGFGVWDIKNGAKKIQNGSELAEEFRESSSKLQVESQNLIKRYEELQKLDA